MEAGGAFSSPKEKGRRAEAPHSGLITQGGDGGLTEGTYADAGSANLGSARAHSNVKLKGGSDQRQYLKSLFTKQHPIHRPWHSYAFVGRTHGLKNSASEKVQL